MTQRDERLTGAIHIVEMLRSVNDTSLSDWYGVIGEELEKKKEQQEETEARREQTVIDALDKISHMVEDYRKEPKETIDESKIISQIEDMRAELTGIALGIRTPFQGRVSSPPFPTRNKIYLPCPACQSDVEIKHSRAGKVKYKSYICGSCHTRLVVRPSLNGEPVIELRRPLSENITCPLCGTEQVVDLDNVAGATLVVNCQNCRDRIRTSRSMQGISCTPVDSNRVEQVFLSAVRNLLPPQPWPKGIHSQIALKLGTTGTKVQKAITQLIEAGVFRPQIDGVVYESVENTPKHQQPI